MDHRLNDRHMINGWWSTQEISSLVQGPLPGPVFGQGGINDSANRPQFLRFNYNWIITPTTSLHVTYGNTGCASISTMIASAKAGRRSWD